MKVDDIFYSVKSNKLFKIRITTIYDCGILGGVIESDENQFVGFYYKNELFKTPFGAIQAEMENIRIERRKLIDRYIQLQKMEDNLAKVPV